MSGVAGGLRRFAWQYVGDRPPAFAGVQIRYLPGDVPLSTAGNTNGNVILRIDLLSGGYAAMDNFVVAASDTPVEVPPIPEPATVALM